MWVCGWYGGTLIAGGPLLALLIAALQLGAKFLFLVGSLWRFLLAGSTSSFLLLVASLLLVAMPGAPSSVLLLLVGST